MPFFKQTKSTELEHAERLRDILKSKKKLKSGYKLSKWADQFKRLRNEVGLARLETALDYYARVCGNEFIPQAYSAMSFRQKFTSIEAAQSREAADVPTTELSKEATFCLHQFQAVWPRNEKEQEITFVQRTVDNYQSFLLGLYTISQKKSKLQRLAAHLLTTLPDVCEFTVRYMQKIHKIAYTWPAWKGNLLAWAFQPHSRFMREWFVDMVKSYCGFESMWDELLKQIGEINAGK